MFRVLRDSLCRSALEHATRPCSQFCLVRLAGRGGLGGNGAAAAVKGALLVVPSGALGGIDDAVVVGVDLVEALAEAAVTLGLGEPGKPVVVRLGLFKPGTLALRQIGGRKLGGQLGLALLDKAHPPIPVLVEGDRLLTSRGKSGGGFGGSTGLGRLGRKPEGGADKGGSGEKRPFHGGFLPVE